MLAHMKLIIYFIVLQILRINAIFPHIESIVGDNLHISLLDESAKKMTNPSMEEYHLGEEIQEELSLKKDISQNHGSPYNTIEYENSIQFTYTTIQATVSPCKDFFRFACGSWSKQHPITNAFNVTSIFTTEFEETKKKEILDYLTQSQPSPSIPESETSLFTRAKTSFSRCMNSKDPLSGANSILQNLKKKYETPQPQSKTPFFYNVLTQLSALEAGVLSTITNVKLPNSLKKTMVIGLPKLLFTTAFVKDTKTYRKKLIEFVSTLVSRDSYVSEQLHLSSPKEIPKFVHDFFIFQDGLSKIVPLHSTPTFFLEPKYILTKQEVINAFPEFQWWLDSKKDTSYCPDCDQDSFIVESSEYLLQLSSFLKKFTPVDIYRYISLVVISTIVADHPKYKNFRSLFLVTPGQLSTIPTDKDICLARVSNAYPGLFARILMRNVDKMNYVNDIKYLARDIWDTMYSIVNDTYCAISQHMCQHLLHKLQNIEVKIHNLTNVNNVSGALKYIFKPNLSDSEDYYNGFAPELLIDDPTVHFFTETSIGPNIRYHYLDNRITIPELYLKVPYYSSQLPPPFVYGSLGSILGHEFYRSFYRSLIELFQFDPTFARTFQSQLNTLREKKDILSQTLQLLPNVFFEIEECEKLAPESLAIDDLTAEMAGLEFAFTAYRTQMSLLKHDVPHGLWHSSDHLFFLAYAQTRCETSTRSSQNYMVHHFGRLTNHVRTNFILKNFKPFIESFQCPMA